MSSRRANVVSRHVELHSKRIAFPRDSLVLCVQCCELRVYAIELRIERIEIESRAVHALRERRRSPRAAYRALSDAFGVAAPLVAPIAPQIGADSSGDEKAGLSLSSRRTSADRTTEPLKQACL